MHSMKVTILIQLLLQLNVRNEILVDFDSPLIFLLTTVFFFLQNCPVAKRHFTSNLALCELTHML